MKTKNILRTISLLTLLVALVASPGGALALAQQQATGPTATIQVDSSGVRLAATTAFNVGDTQVYSIGLQNLPAEGLTSAEFACRYDPTVVEVSGFTDAGLFGAGAASTLNGPLGGTFVYAIAGANNNRATIAGTVFKFSMKALKTGSFVFDCQVRASKGTDLFTITFVPATITVTEPSVNGTLVGKVTASKPVTVTLLSGATTIATTTAAADGSFSLTALAGSYTVVASAPGFLKAQGAPTLTAGVTTTMPTIALIAGDVDGNGKIDSLDVLTIGINYNKTTPAEADFNNDGTINLLDLQILAKNYPKTGPISW
ncbi:MAG TPA: dockerin type I domain-containing protein [Anaerolineales bacterium]